MSLESAANNPEVQKLLPKIYDDLLSIPFKKVSVALGDTLELVLFFSKYAKYRSQRIDATLDANLIKFKKNLESVLDENVIAAPLELSVPIFEKLFYTTNEELSNMYVSLLTKASDSEQASKAHPAFIQMIERLSTDEAKIVQYFIGKREILYANIRAYTSSNRKGFSDPAKYLTELNNLPLDYKDNIPTYLSNLISMGVLVDKSPMMRQNPVDYDKIKLIHGKNFEATKAHYLKTHPEYEFIWQHSLFEISTFGQMFIKSCTTTLTDSPTAS